MTQVLDNKPDTAPEAPSEQPLRLVERVAYVFLAFLPATVLLGASGVAFAALRDAALAGASGGCGGG